jgi:hypothetical protein
MFSRGLIGFNEVGKLLDADEGPPAFAFDCLAICCASGVTGDDAAIGMAAIVR